MKKKILKIFLTILILVLILFAVNYFRNYLILKNIYNKTNGYLDNINNFYYKETKYISNSSIQDHEYWYKNGIYLAKFSQNGKILSLIWGNLNTNESWGGEYLEDNTFQESPENTWKEFNPKTQDTYSKVLFDELDTFKDVVKSNMFRFIPCINNCYIINTPNFQKNINIDSGLVKNCNSIFKSAQNYETTSFLIENIVTDKDVVKPAL